MQRISDQRCQKLAQISQRARELVQRVDENLTDALSLMDLNFSLDGLGQLYNDLGRACELSKLAKIPGKCVDLAKKLADEVSSDWLGLDPVNAESEETTSENSESQLEEELNKNEEDLDKNTQSESNDENDDSAIGVSTCHSESTNGDKLSNQESEVKPALASEAASQGALKQNEGYVSLRSIDQDYHRAYMRALMPSSNAELIANGANGNLDALSGLSESDDDSSNMVSSVDEKFPETVLDDTTSEMLSSQLDVLTIEAHDLNALVEVRESHDGNTKVDPVDKADETTDEADNLVNFSKPLEYGEFEDIDLMNDWEDDIDYDLDLVSCYQSKKSSKKKLAAKFISRLRHSKKSQLSEVAHKSEANTADSDWEIV